MEVNTTLNFVASGIRVGNDPDSLALISQLAAVGLPDSIERLDERSRFARTGTGIKKEALWLCGIEKSGDLVIDGVIEIRV